MENNKKLSIITICYNDPNLERTCESIINQTWQDFEWIVIDGGSNEETQKIWDKYKYRIDKFVSEPDKGIYNACNKGIKLATGEYINFMNAGDSFYSVDVLKNVFKCEYTQDIIYGDTYFFKSRDYLYSKRPEILGIDFWINNNINTQSTFVKRYLFNKYGYYDEKFKIAADFDRWLLFREKGATFAHIPFIVACFDQNGISFDANNADLHNEERKIILSKYHLSSDIGKIKYSFLEQIFSVKRGDNNHKIITVLGIHIKIKIRRG